MLSTHLILFFQFYVRKESRLELCHDYVCSSIPCSQLPAKEFPCWISWKGVDKDHPTPELLIPSCIRRYDFLDLLCQCFVVANRHRGLSHDKRPRKLSGFGLIPSRGYAYILHELVLADEFLDFGRGDLESI